MTSPNGSVRVLLWLAGVAVFLLGVFGAGYAALDAKKADKDALATIQTDVREIRNFLLGEPRR